MICAGDHVQITTGEGTAYGTAIGASKALVTVRISPGATNTGLYAGWHGIEMFLPSQITVLPDDSGRPHGKVLAPKRGLWRIVETDAEPDTKRPYVLVAHDETARQAYPNTDRIYCVPRELHHFGK